MDSAYARTMAAAFMILHAGSMRAARPYAQAAFNIAVQSQRLDVWEQLLQSAALAAQHAYLGHQLRQPGIHYTQPAQWLAQICAPVLFELGQRFLVLLAQRGRLLILPAIASCFNYYRLQYENTVKVIVDSAVDLSESEQAQLQQQLTTCLQRRVVLENRVDAQCLGGVRLRIEDQVLDATLRGRLNRLKLNLLK